ncbi:hypothetical protein [Ancylobacter vacuolatus]|uniref:Uncharacterized protein n=1 Tax=Ancylobacter vacuolatus TaxID=223389 RepID=A0ABU0DPC0_9HYPH|nr:hypothetical protein [Ancylobacter vacuolatus]MDQ0350156.1 hypothetical protein [Ancylobacter vacuolatus]
MTTTYTLKGFADSVGRGQGFLLPIFGRRASNADFVQRVSDTGVILGFETIGELDARVLYHDQVDDQAVAGDAAIMAFGFAEDDIVVDRLDPFRRKLAARLNDPILASNALLAIEVSEFLGDGQKRLEFAERAYLDIERRSAKAARHWSDLSLLSADVRAALAEESGRPISDFRKVVAIRENERVRLAGLPADLVSNSRLHRHAVRIAMEGLPSLYKSGESTWPVDAGKFVERHGGGPDAEAIVWLVDRGIAEARSAVEDDFSWRVDAFGPEEFESFTRAAKKAKGTPAFAVIGRDISQIEIDRMLDPRVTTIEIGASVAAPRIYEQEEQRRLRILVPPSGFNGSRGSAQSIGAMIRLIVAALSAERGRSKHRMHAFVKARGMGEFPQIDACAAIYDRLMLMNLGTSGGVAIPGARNDHRSYDDRQNFVELFEDTQLLEGRRVRHEMRKSAADLALLVPIRRRRREDDGEFARLIKALLARRGLNPSGGRSDDTVSFYVDVAGSLRVVEIPDSRGSYRANWTLSDVLYHRDLDRIETVSVRPDATPSVILGMLHIQNHLVANLRDLSAADPAGGIWSILGSQFRRQSGGLASKGRSHFMALLVNHALNRNAAPSHLHQLLFENIHSSALGRELHFTWGKVRQGKLKTHGEVQLFRRSGRSLKSSADAIVEFMIDINPDGVSLEPLTRD